MKKILHICAALHDGGVERSVLNYVRLLDRDKVRIDFVVHSMNRGMLEDELEELGCEIYHVVPKSEASLAYTRHMLAILKSGGYDAVHCHQGYSSWYPLFLAKTAGVETRIAHSHTAGEGFTGRALKKKEHECSLTRRIATSLAATGKGAGEYMWSGSGYTILPPIIDAETLLFDPEARAIRREALKTGDCPVVGCACRLVRSKNLLRLLDIFAEVKKIREDAVLLIVGDGPMRADIISHIVGLGLKDVILEPASNNIGEYYSAMDVFVLPTLFEGMGMVFAEAQINGLTVFASKNAVPDDVKISDRISFVGLDRPDAEWAQLICAAFKKGSADRSRISDCNYELFDGTHQIQKLKELYGI